MSLGEKNSAESIRHRLRNAVRARGDDVQFALVRSAAERFLFRLSASRHRDNFVLKGALLLTAWGASVYRPTRDIDFAGRGKCDPATLLDAVREICAMPVPDDGLVFDQTSLRAEPIRDASEYRGLRVRFVGRVGDSRIPMQVDIGVGDDAGPTVETVAFPTLLGGDAPRIRAYSVEAVIAEKMHAMVVLGEGNSRMKDFHDVFVLAEGLAFAGPRLLDAIVATFARRRTPWTPTAPSVLMSAFYRDKRRARMWDGYRTKAGVPSSLPPFELVGHAVQAFLRPLRNSVVEGGVFERAWKPGGPWR